MNVDTYLLKAALLHENTVIHLPPPTLWARVAAAAAAAAAAAVTMLVVRERGQTPPLFLGPLQLKDTKVLSN